jgi:hypothetical protein
MMTILHVIPTLEGGGAERQLSMLAAEQARRGLDVHIYDAVYNDVLNGKS